MSRKIRNAFFIVSLAILPVSATILEAKAAAAIVLNPTTGAPGSSVALTGTGFAASKTVGIGWGPEGAIVDDPVTVTTVGTLEFYGTTSQHPIKPGSFRWKYQRGTVDFTITDDGDGTLSDPSQFLSSGEINYTPGYFHRIMTSSTQAYTADTPSYTTYRFNSTFPDLLADGSGAISVTLTVPQIWNGSETGWVIDEKGKVGSGNFTVVNSPVVPEPLTFGGVVLLSSAALILSVYFLRKKPAPKVAA
jgi:hypothetical protein